jgi:HAMP domain-containing protein
MNGERNPASRGATPADDPTRDSYYGQPILNAPVWGADIPAYLFLGGLAGASSVLAAGAQATRRPLLARRAKLGALGAIVATLGALIHDLGRPSRFLNMLRVFKPSSPMSVGTWILSAYAPAAGIAAASDVTGLLPMLGGAATSGAALLGPAVASYTSALIADTAVPAWHDGHRELPFVFVGSAASAAAGWGLLTAPTREAGPARRLATLGAVTELVASRRLERRVGPIVSAAYHEGTPGRLMKLSKTLTAAGALGALVSGRRGRRTSAASGAALLAASACTRFAIFHAGMASAREPRHTVLPQRERSGR